MHHMHYHRPATVAEAVKLIGDHGDDKILAGGQSLLPAMKLGLATPEGFIDLAGIAEMQGIKVEGNALRIGAMTTHAAVAPAQDVQGKIRALAQLAGGIGDRGVRNRGTICCSLGNNHPATCYPAAALTQGPTNHTNQRT